jgi:hypothetical protein
VLNVLSHMLMKGFFLSQGLVTWASKDGLRNRGRFLDRGAEGTQAARVPR